MFDIKTEAASPAASKEEEEDEDEVDCGGGGICLIGISWLKIQAENDDD